MSRGVASRWPQGFCCPHCTHEGHSTFVHQGRQYWQCQRCRHQTTVLAGTVFDATKLPLAMHLMTQAKNNVSALELKRHLGLRYKSAWLMKHKLLQVMVEREAYRVLKGRVARRNPSPSPRTPFRRGPIRPWQDLGKMTVGILGKLERVVSPGIAVLRLESTVFTRRNSGRVTACRPEPTAIAVWLATSPATALKQ
jgi:transposase-like protein